MELIELATLAVAHPAREVVEYMSDGRVMYAHPAREVVECMSDGRVMYAHPAREVVECMSDGRVVYGCNDVLTHGRAGNDATSRAVVLLCYAYMK